MPLVALPVELPENLVEVQAGDLDGDGVSELVVASTLDGRGAPDKLRLTVYQVPPSGAPTAAGRVELGAEPQFWALKQGLWAVDGAGVVRLEPGQSPARVAALTTPLAGLGPTTPVSGPIAQDLDQDGQAEIWAYGGGRVHAWGSEGQALGSHGIPSHGSLANRDDRGGHSLRSTHRAPALAFADMDGDGLLDLLAPMGKTLNVAYSGRADGAVTLAARSARFALPMELDRRDGPELKVQRRVTDAEFADVDGDGRADLVLHIVVSTGSWFGSTAEVLLYRNTGAAFEPVQTLATGVGSTTMELVDVDADGDLDLLLDQVDVGFTNLAKGLLSKSINVDYSLFRFAGEGFSQSAEVIAQLTLPLEQPHLVRSLHGDFNLDGLPDLVVADEGRLELRLQSAGGWETVAGSADLTEVADEVLIGDFTGDGVPELLLWAPKRSTATLARWK